MFSVLKLAVTIFFALVVTSTAVTLNTTISFEDSEGGDSRESTSVLSSKQIITAANNEPANLFGSSTTETRDFFLFSGQSNAIGHTTSSKSITRNVTYWMNLLHLFMKQSKMVIHPMSGKKNSTLRFNQCIWPQTVQRV